MIARERNVQASEIKHDRDGDDQTLIGCPSRTELRTLVMSLVLFGGDKPRLVEIKGIRVEAELVGHVLRHRRGQAGLDIRPGRQRAGRGPGQHRDLPSAAPRRGADAICLVQVSAIVCRAADGALHALAERVPPPRL